MAEALEVEPLRRGLPEVVAGAQRLGRPIRWVHAGEVPNIASLLSGGELLLTTGMGMADRAADQRRFIAELSGRGVAALVVELGGALKTLPAPLIAAAQAQELPLVVLRREVPFVAVTEAIHTAIINSHYALLQQGEDIHRSLTKVLLEGEKLGDVLHALAELLGNPVYLEDADGYLIYCAAPADQTPDAVAAWRAARQPGQAPWSAALSVPVPMRNERQGRLLVLPLNVPLDDLSDIALRHAVDVVALALLRLLQEEELRARGQGNFLVDLVNGRVTAEGARRYAEVLGFTSVSGSLLPLAACSAGEPQESEWSITVRDLQAVLQAHGYSCLAGPNRQAGDLLCLVSVRGGQQREELIDGVVSIVRTAIEQRVAVERPVIAVGQICDWSEVAEELGHACDSAAAAHVLPHREWFDAHTLELPRLLWHWRGQPELQRFVQRTLGPLLEHDARRKQKLLSTLETLCAYNGQKAETARALHLNRQALYHRLSRIEEILSVDLSLPHTMLTLHLALEAMRYLREPPAAG